MSGFTGLSTAHAAGPDAIDLLSIETNNFAILAQTTITDADPTVSAITGNVGLSPAAGSFITGLSCSEVLPIGTGKIYDVGGTYTGGHDSNVTCLMPGPGANKTLVDNAVADMGTAYTAATTGTPAGVGATNLNVGGGTLNGQTFVPGTYTWNGGTSNVTITGDITLSGSATDVWIFQIAGTLDISNSKKILLSGGAQPSNIFWAVAGATTLVPGSTFEGTILAQTNIAMQAGAILNGRALAQTAVTLIGNTITVPVPSVPAVPSPSSSSGNTVTVVTHVINDNGGTATFPNFSLFVNGNAVISGQSVRMAPGTYTVTQTSLPNYTMTFSGDCNASGQINHGGVNTHNSICIVTNDDVGPSGAVPPFPPLIDVVEVPNPLALPSGSGPVTYTYTLRNIGTVPVTDILMIGDTCSPFFLVSGDNNINKILEVNETWTYRCTTTLAQTQTSTVVTTGWANGLSATDIASATVVVGASVVPPLIHVTKIPSPLTLLATGGIVTYTNRVTNPGTVALSNVRLADNKCSSVSYSSGDTNGDSKLDTTETWIYTCQMNLTQTTTNTVIASGDANGLTARDFAIVTVVVATASSTPLFPDTGLGVQMTYSLERMKQDSDSIAVGSFTTLKAGIAPKGCEMSEAQGKARVTAVFATQANESVRARIAAFTSCGTVSTVSLGAGERLGVVASYRAAFGHLPSTSAEWNDVVKIANGRFPSELSASAELSAKARFQTVYRRNANMLNQNDKAAVTIMAYGLRPKPRNLNSEAAAIVTFRATFQTSPVSATQWDTVRAIAYSGAKR